ncbi:MAG: hypothetical protein K2N06_12965, partial [Oscillospiraceae bacterium]|nr:hypothetical protein [Oscillospiraceae bacterium]
MITFICALVILVLGYFLYGKLAERVFKPDDRPTPASEHPDGVDYVPMKTWRVFLVQLLNMVGYPEFGITNLILKKRISRKIEKKP